MAVTPREESGCRRLISAKQAASHSPWECLSPTLFSSLTVSVFVFFSMLRQHRSLLSATATVFYRNHKRSFLRGGWGSRGLSQLVLSLQEAGRPPTSRHPREPLQSVKATQGPRQNTSNNPTKCFVGLRKAKKKKKPSNYNKLCLTARNCEKYVPSERHVGSRWLFIL